MSRFPFQSLSAVMAGVCLSAFAPKAQASDDVWKVRYEIDIPVTAALLAGTWGVSQIPVDRSHVPKSSLLFIDIGVQGTYSSQASNWSDATLAFVLVAPVFMIASTGLDASTGHRAMIYTETLAGTLFLTQTAKYVAQRPRPFVYSDDPKHHSRSKSEDSRLSFFSGHSSIAFAAAVSGSYMFAVHSEDKAARSAFWGVELAMATITAGMRVRAGKHYPTDVIFGAGVGAGLGLAIPRLHLNPPSRYSPSPAEWAAMAGGVSVGLAATMILPAAQDPREPSESGNIQLIPIPLAGGAGFMVLGTL